jgi:hypothetical protein
VVAAAAVVLYGMRRILPHSHIIHWLLRVAEEVVVAYLHWLTED